jgi:hypothetical protein
MTTRLVRTKGGAVVHRASCTTIDPNAVTSTVAPWLWAEGRTDTEIQQAIAMVGARACKICKPVHEGTNQ